MVSFLSVSSISQLQIKFVETCKEENISYLYISVKKMPVQGQKRKRKSKSTLSLGKKHKRQRTVTHSVHCQTECRGINRTTQISAEVVNKSVQYDSYECECDDPVQLAVNEFTNHTVLPVFFRKLFQQNQLQVFCTFVQLVISSDFSLSNIAWQAFLDRVKWQSCTSTTVMKYQPEVKEFWALLKNMFGSSVLNVLRGPAHFGKVVTEECERSSYDPNQGTCNFAIPSTSTLNRMETEYGKYVPAGFIQQTLDICQRQSKKGHQYVLSFDAKKLAPGLKNEVDGDIDLLGFEGPPSLHDKICILNGHIAKIETFMCKIKEDRVIIHQNKLLELLINVSRKIRSLRRREWAQGLLRQRLIKLSQNNPGNLDYYKKSMSRVNLNEYQLKTLTQRAHELNLSICRSIAHVRGVSSLIPLSRYVDVSTWGNAFRLLHPDVISQFFDLEREHMFIKQGTHQWKEQRLLARVTGSTLFRALGLDTLKRQKIHHDEFVLKMEPPPVSKAVKRILAHGSDNEVM